jgi:hypothetical protein
VVHLKAAAEEPKKKRRFESQKYQDFNKAYDLPENPAGQSHARWID